MKLSYALLLAAAGAPLAASAQADQAAPPPYRSVFTGYVGTPENTLTPDQVWRQSNRDVAAPGAGHAGHMHHGQGASTGHAAMDHGKMDHGKMDHSTMDHGTASPATADHGKMDHGGADHGKMHHGSRPQSQDRQDRHAGHGKQPAGKPANTPASPAPAQHQHKDR